jgi:hypothetical protein
MVPHGGAGERKCKAGQHGQTTEAGGGEQVHKSAQRGGSAGTERQA